MGYFQPNVDSVDVIKLYAAQYRSQRLQQQHLHPPELVKEVSYITDTHPQPVAGFANAMTATATA